ncbi:imelysin family protein [Aquimarina mycalae]|uniref:imelysin family protein n=1 Tax=Aquimarina mycalae TaxID=3040073 RepID=UPI002477DE18|nr:imelysin family protein [Aquimarina sp. 2201CG14-23]MDH7446970.1 imelysin family protein [Aquimarina sp. 2201CG14-23]
MIKKEEGSYSISTSFFTFAKNLLRINKNKMKKFRFLIIVLVLVIASCSSSDDGTGTVDNFDRKAMLENLADNIIIPAYQKFSTDLAALKTATSNFVSTTDEANLVSLRQAWSTAYISWQSVSMFEIGKAEELLYRDFLNVYPVDITNIEANISTGTYDLSSVSLQDEQGFGALDYLLNGLSDSDASTVGFYTNPTSGSNYENYLVDVVDRISNLTSEVVGDWTGNYRDTFVNNSGSSATSSLDKLVNDFIFHYEKHLRAGKIGIPAGVFSGNPLDDRVEALYKKDLSKTLFNANLSALQDFFNGKHFNGSVNGESLKTYLDNRDNKELAVMINNQFNLSRTAAAGLNDDFSEQVRTNNNLMLETYNELQKNVVFLKVDMLSVISVNVDFVDADGD